MSVDKMRCYVVCLGSLCLRGFKTSFIHRFYGVSGVTLTVSDVSEDNSYILHCASASRVRSARLAHENVSTHGSHSASHHEGKQMFRHAHNAQ